MDLMISLVWIIFASILLVLTALSGLAIARRFQCDPGRPSLQSLSVIFFASMMLWAECLRRAVDVVSWVPPDWAITAAYLAALALSCLGASFLAFAAFITYASFEGQQSW